MASVAGSFVADVVQKSVASDWPEAATTSPTPRGPVVAILRLSPFARTSMTDQPRRAGSPIDNVVYPDGRFVMEVVQSRRGSPAG
jgi:hypothetical protein